MSEMLLCADVGGTNTRLRLVRAGALSSAVVEENYGDGVPVVEAVERFVASHEAARRIVAAGFGIAGRVVDGDVRMTNRPSEVITDERLAEVLGIDKRFVAVVNDMVAHLSGVNESRTICLREGSGQGAVEGIVMPGTGLGVGFAVWHDGRRVAMPGEGGHLDFGPPAAALDGLLSHGRRQRAVEGTDDRVSWEWFLSGPGLARMYAWLDPALQARPDAWRAVSPRDVTGAAFGEASPLSADLARRTLDRFIGLCGARAGNLCVELLTTRGIWLGGNILNMLHDHDPARFVEQFLREFHAVGPAALRETLQGTPIHLIRSADSGLRGAAVLARERM